ncbi:hypothetical protein MMC28_007757 [Mycoblastus sanguinarius]|nr:hypothetical protein [Mycoblastus sanguinarius]
MPKLVNNQYSEDSPPDKIEDLNNQILKIPAPPEQLDSYDKEKWNRHHKFLNLLEVLWEKFHNRNDVWQYWKKWIVKEKDENFPNAIEYSVCQTLFVRSRTAELWLLNQEKISWGQEIVSKLPADIEWRTDKWKP